MVIYTLQLHHCKPLMHQHIANSLQQTLV